MLCEPFQLHLPTKRPSQQEHLGSAPASPAGCGLSKTRAWGIHNKRAVARALERILFPEASMSSMKLAEPFKFYDFTAFSSAIEYERPSSVHSTLTAAAMHSPQSLHAVTCARHAAAHDCGRCCEMHITPRKSQAQTRDLPSLMRTAKWQRKSLDCLRRQPLAPHRTERLSSFHP